MKDVTLILDILKTLMFYRWIYGRQLYRPGKCQIAFWTGIFVLYMSGKFLGWNELFLLGIFSLQDFLLGIVFSDLRVSENLKYWTVKVFSSVALEESIYQVLAFILPFVRKQEEVRVLFITIIEIFIFCILHLLSKRKMTTILSWKNVIVFSGSFGMIIVFLSTMQFIIDEYIGQRFQMAASILHAFAAVGFCIVIILFIHIFRQKDYFQSQAVLESAYNNQQREYFHILLEKEKETRKFRHDMMSHMLCLKAMAENGDVEGIQRYLEESLHIMEQISGKGYSVGNETIDVLLNHYLFPVRESCLIEVEGVFGKAENISRMELCTIFSNVFKNAVEAVSLIPLGNPVKKFIRIHAFHGERFMKMTIQNSYVGEIKIENGRIRTGKRDEKNHGFGMENARTAVERCGGSFEFKVENDCFLIQILLPVKTEL